MTALEFARENLFSPLNITDVVWPSNPQGINTGWGGIKMRPHDMAKIGYLYLNKGIWEEERILSSSWIKTSTSEYISATLQDGYGYQWWVDDSGMYMALGYAGQFIYAVPDKNMVVVFTSDLDDSNFYAPQQLLFEYILPAAKSSNPLPANPEGTTLLQSLSKQLSNPR
jgi:CubicO group peptidase (beta-lactamase class C family)